MSTLTLTASKTSFASHPSKALFIVLGSLTLGVLLFWVMVSTSMPSVVTQIAPVPTPSQWVATATEPAPVSMGTVNVQVPQPERVATPAIQNLSPLATDSRNH
jgi:hypothetical protein